MTRLEGGICSTCDHYLQCTWHGHLNIWDCSEFQQPPIEFLPQSTSSTSKTYANGSICSNCDQISTCQWHKEGTIILQCEHYE